jgi:hypothetical protein
MSASIVRDSLVRRPFAAFRLRLSSGDAFEIRHPENALLVKSGVYLAVPDKKGNLPETATRCSFLHIAAVEPLPGQNSAKKNGS